MPPACHGPSPRCFQLELTHIQLVLKTHTPSFLLLPEAFVDPASEVPLLSPKTLCCIPSVGGAPLCLEPEPSVHAPLLTPLNHQRGMSSALLASRWAVALVGLPSNSNSHVSFQTSQFPELQAGLANTVGARRPGTGGVGDSDRHGKRCQTEQLGQVSLTTGTQGREKA